MSQHNHFERHFPHLAPSLATTIKTLLLCSEFANKRFECLKQLLQEDPCTNNFTREHYFNLVERINLQSTQANFMAAIRQLRNQQFLRLIILELAGIATTEQVLQSWSDCADALILHVLNYCKLALKPRFGTARNQAFEEVELYCLGMGKLGGLELNYSSDIDLIFTFSEAGQTDGEEKEANAHYFTKLIQQFVHIMQTQTVDGFVFRVDLRLRPNGDSGPLVYSLAAMETYYQEQGRDWERYAMVKARVIANDAYKMPAWYGRLIIPFVYRRYVDFSVIESLRSMKALIEREVALNPGLNDIKRGKGGIREIEFIIQNFQLIRGGRLPQLQQQNALKALAVLKENLLFPRCDALKDAYLFLRKLENALQALDDKQTHSLPSQDTAQAQIALAMGFATWEELEKRLHKYQRIVSNSFAIVLGKVEAYEDEKRMLAQQLTMAWQGNMEESMAINLLKSIGYENAAQCYQMIHTFRQSTKCKRLSHAARMHLDRFMVLLLSELTQYPKTDQLLLQVMHLLENIITRSPYLALLSENPQALNELLYWLTHSPFITALLVNQPFLLDLLLNQPHDWKPLSVSALQKQIQEQLTHCTELEEKQEQLRQFKSMHWLMAARAELNGFCHSVRIGQFLADLAQVVVIEVLHCATEELSVRYPEIKKIQSRFAIIAYGKLGSREMNFNSDLDLVFLHNLHSEQEALVTRLTQKIVHMLTMRSQAGVLYAVDTRLRPSGSAGLLVSNIDAFIAYQKEKAWTWEHQSLLKARMIFGSAKVKVLFQKLKQDILLIDRDKDKLKQDVVAMREKMAQILDKDPVKAERGGLLDLEFLVQYLLLQSGHAEFAKCTHTLSQMQLLHKAGILDKQQYDLLRKAYRHYHHVLLQNLVKPGLQVDNTMQEQVLNVYWRILG